MAATEDTIQPVSRNWCAPTRGAPDIRTKCAGDPALALRRRNSHAPHMSCPHGFVRRLSGPSKANRSTALCSRPVVGPITQRNSAQLSATQRNSHARHMPREADQPGRNTGSIAPQQGSNNCRSSDVGRRRAQGSDQADRMTTPMNTSIEQTSRYSDPV